MAHAVGLTAENRRRFEVSCFEICGAQSGTVTSFSPSTSFFPCHYYSTNVHQIYLHLRVALTRKTKRTMAGNLKKSLPFTKSERIGYKSVFTLTLQD